MPFEIIQTDITTLEVDAIVSSVSSVPGIGGGVDGRINDVAGPDLFRCRSAFGVLEPGVPVMTPGFKLPARHVIHVVGPVFEGGMDNEDKRLFKTYMNVLEYAEEQGLSSIAFPVISSGRFRFPREWALSIALSAIRAFLETHEMMVFLVIYHEPSHALSRERFDAIRNALSAFGLARPRESRKKQTSFSYLIDDDLEPVRQPRKSESDHFSIHPFKQRDFRLGKTFVQHLFDLIDQKGLDDVYVYKKANVDRKLFSKIRSDDNYKPSKRTALAFAFALELGIEETDTLIMKAGYALSDADTFDMIVRYMISSEIWDLYEVNKTLFAFGQKTIGCD